MRYIDIRDQSRVHAAHVDSYIHENRLPPSWFDIGYDHIAIKAFNRDDYEDLIEDYKGFAEEIVEADLDGRQISTVKLLGNYAIGMALNSAHQFNQVNYVELMLARPEDQSYEPARLDHSEIFVQRGLTPVRIVLQRKGIHIFEQSNRNHSWISVTMNDGQDGLKFTDRRLRELSKMGLRQGSARKIYG